MKREDRGGFRGGDKYSDKIVFLKHHLHVHLMKISDKNLETIKKLCAKYQVKSFSAFGSVTRDDFNEQSDIDFVVDFDEKDPIRYTDLYFELKENLEKLLQRQIDLIEERGIKNYFFKKELKDTKVLIYGQ
jgi:uncharacterized protein